MSFARIVIVLVCLALSLTVIVQWSLIAGYRDVAVALRRDLADCQEQAKSIDDCIRAARDCCGGGKGRGAVGDVP